MTFKWRHWGTFTGPLRCPLGLNRDLTAPPTGDTIEIFGMGIAKLTPDFKITKLEIYYDPDDLLKQMVGCPGVHHYGHLSASMSRDAGSWLLLSIALGVSQCAQCAEPRLLSVYWFHHVWFGPIVHKHLGNRCLVFQSRRPARIITSYRSLSQP